MVGIKQIWIGILYFFPTPSTLYPPYVILVRFQKVIGLWSHQKMSFLKIFPSQSENFFEKIFIHLGMWDHQISWNIPSKDFNQPNGSIPPEPSVPPPFPQPLI